MENYSVYDFGLRLRQLRESRGLSRAALARKIGVSKETIYRYENNTQDPPLDRAKALAITLRTSLDYLVGLEHAQTLLLPPMSEEQQVALREFLRVFVEKPL